MVRSLPCTPISHGIAPGCSSPLLCVLRALCGEINRFFTSFMVLSVAVLCALASSEGSERCRRALEIAVALNPEVTLATGPRRPPLKHNHPHASTRRSEPRESTDTSTFSTGYERSPNPKRQLTTHSLSTCIPNNSRESPGRQWTRRRLSGGAGIAGCTAPDRVR